MSVVGSRIREYRLKRGLTQGQIAEKLGMTEANFSSYERGKSIPPGDKLKQIAELLDVSTDYLLGQTDDPSIHREEYLPEVRAIQRAAKNMTPKDRERMLNMIKAAFEEAFAEDD